MTIIPMKTSNLAEVNLNGSAIVRSFWNAWIFRQQQRESVRHLRSMPDYLLKDVGIHRSKICSVVYGISHLKNRFD